MPSRFFSIFIVCALYGIPALYAQDNISVDSLIRVYENQKDDTIKVNTLVELYNAFLYNDPGKALDYATEELQLSEKIGYAKGIAYAFYHIGVVCSNTNQVDSAIYYYNQANRRFSDLKDTLNMIMVSHGLAILEYSQGNYDVALNKVEENIGMIKAIETNPEKLENSYDLALAYNLKGNIHIYKGNYQIALHEILKSLRIFETINKPIRKADAFNQLGSIELYLKNFEKSIEYNAKALQIYRNFNDKIYESVVLNDIGNAFYFLEKYPEAIDYLEKSLLLSRQMKIVDLEGTSLTNLGKVYTRLGDYDKAVNFLNESLKIHEASQSKNKIIESLNDLDKAFLSMKKPEEALPYFNRAIGLANAVGSKENLSAAYENRSQAYEALNKHTQALADYKAYKAVGDSILNEVKTRQIEDLRTIYETEKKEQEIALQGNEIQLLESKARISALQRILLGLGLALSVVIFSLALFGARQKMKRKEIETAREKETYEKELSFKKRELATHTLHLVQKNELLESLKNKLEELKGDSGADKNAINRLVRIIKSDEQSEKDWANFQTYFEQVHEHFDEKLRQRFNELTNNEIRLAALLKMNLSSKEIAAILNISPDSVNKARYRLRKKPGLSSEDSLENFLFAL